jgi:P27 family predicted phage terminase small subunit
MNKRGPRNKPIKLRVLEGNRSRVKIPEEVLPPADPPYSPSHLDAYALEEWNRIAEGLNGMGILAGIDQQAFGAYCVAYGRWRSAEEELQTLRERGGALNALVLKTVSGNYIQQPLIGISNKAAAAMMRYAVEFGLTPSARARLAMDPNRATKGKFDGLVNVKGGGKK